MQEKQVCDLGQIFNTEVITCPSLNSPMNGAITFTPGAENSNTGLGSVATYSCYLGYVLVGQTTRVCQNSIGVGVWSGSQPTCQGDKKQPTDKS